MDRLINYPGAIPLDTDLLNTNKNTMLAFGMALQALLGTSTLVDGLACTPTGPASLQVYVGQGSIMTYGNVDSTSYGSLAADTTNQVLKQGISLSQLTLSCPAPVTVGQSINYLIQAAYQDNDTNSVVLPYYNASNPSVAYSGPANSGTAQYTLRQGKCVVSAKAGTAATTGSQTTPAADSGYTGLWVVTVANGQTQITSPNIVAVNNAPFISEKLTAKISQATGDVRYLQIANSRTKLNANTTFYIATTGNDTTGTGLVGAPWLTRQKAWNVIQQNYDLNGYTATVQLADGTYTDTFSPNGGPIGQSGPANIVFNGNVATPANVLVAPTTASCWTATYSAAYQIQNMKITSTGSYSSVSSIYGGTIYLGVGIEFGAGGISQINADTAPSIVWARSAYKISGAAATHWRAVNGGQIDIQGVTVTITGTPAFSSYFAQGSDMSRLLVVSNTFSGAATGVRYLASVNSLIQTAGAGATYLPGNAAGSVANGGLYL